MTNGRKRTKVEAAKSPEPDQVTLTHLAKVATSPTLGAAVVIRAFLKINDGDLDLPSVRTELLDQAKKVSAGDLSQVEVMLLSQAQALSAVFTALANRAQANMGEYVDAADRYMRLALKSQSQCRATLETLAAIKNPTMVFAKQANVTTGPQQVNNGSFPTLTRAPAPAREYNSDPNKLLEATNGERMDTRTSDGTSRSDQELAALEAIHRTSNR